MKVGILGAGASGLVSLKCTLEEGHDVMCFERTANLGGCWSGDGRVGNDELENHISSGMYKGLTTNIPKEVMIFRDHPPIQNPRSFVNQAHIIKYLRTYAEKFNLATHIKFGHEVKQIKPLSKEPNTKWRMTVNDLINPTKTPVDYDFDALMLAPGHFIYPVIADIKGTDLFQGTKFHSNYYRDGAQYTDQRVLIIGGGPSGSDIANDVSKYAKDSFQSIKASSHIFIAVQKSVVRKVEVDHFDITGAHFIDGSYEEIDTVIFCTGYTCNVPCLTPKCGIRIEDNWFKYVYRHCINIEYPTMAVIGLPYRLSLFPLLDLQARYFMALLSKKFQLPSKEVMLQSVLDEYTSRMARGMVDGTFHSVPDCGRGISSGMAQESGITPTPNVIFKIMESLRASWNDQDVFVILDDESFTRTPPENT